MTAKSYGNIKTALIDGEKCMENKRVWLFSPTVNADFDFNANHFDRIYMYLCPGSCPPMGAMQMSGRVRNLADPVKGIPLNRKSARRPIRQEKTHSFFAVG
jgi:hypothetical protein